MLAAFHGWGSHGWVGRLHFIAARWLRSGVNGLAGGMLSMGGGGGGGGGAGWLRRACGESGRGVVWVVGVATI